MALLLIDAHMPEMDGFMLAEQVRLRPALAGVLIMMLSSADRQGDSARCRELGIQLYLTKPIKQADLRDALMKALREPLRTFARDAVQRLNGLTIKERITEIGSDIFTHAQELTKNTPFKVTSVVVGNIQYPQEVEDAVARKMAATQLLEQKQTEIEIEEREKQKRVVQAEGIARAMEIISERLTTQYLQHEAIEAQKAMVNSPNHTTIYIPVGPMGVPLVGTLDTAQSQKKQ